MLQKSVKEGKAQFEVFPQWGSDLGSEHERFITEKVFQKPTIVINYPKGIKAFYMKLNDDKETVAAMDVLVPQNWRINRRISKRRQHKNIGRKVSNLRDKTKGYLVVCRSQEVWNSSSCWIWPWI